MISHSICPINPMNHFMRNPDTEKGWHVNESRSLNFLLFPQCEGWRRGTKLQISLEKISEYKGRVIKRHLEVASSLKTRWLLYDFVKRRNLDGTSNMINLELWLTFECVDFISQREDRLKEFNWKDFTEESISRVEGELKETKKL